jgi:hypothetical protein
MSQVQVTQATMPEATQARRCYFWGQEGAYLWLRSPQRRKPAGAIFSDKTGAIFGVKTGQEAQESRVQLNALCVGWAMPIFLTQFFSNFFFCLSHLLLLEPRA